MERKVLRRLYLVCLEGKEVYSERNFIRDLNSNFGKDKNYKDLILEKFNLVPIKFFSARVQQKQLNDPISLILKKIEEDIIHSENKTFFKNVIIENYICFLIDRDIVEKEELAIKKLNLKKTELNQFLARNKNIKEFWWLQYPPQMKFEFLICCCHPDFDAKKNKLFDKANIDSFLKAKKIDIEKDIKSYNSKFLKKINYSATEVINNLLANLICYEEKTINCPCLCPPKSVPLINLLKRKTFLDIFHCFANS